MSKTSDDLGREPLGKGAVPAGLVRWRNALRAVARVRFSALVQPGPVLLTAAVILPLLMFAAAAWQNYRSTLAGAEIRVERTVSILEEHAQMVLETQRLVVEQIKDRLPTVDWSRPQQVSDFHDFLTRLQAQTDQLPTITVTDVEGRMLASGMTFPANPKITFGDREWFKAVHDAKGDGVYISRPFIGRQSGRRAFGLVIPSPRDAAGRFAGAIEASIDQGYFERFYRDVEPGSEHSVTLARDDGVILAREPRTERTNLATSQDMLVAMQGGEGGRYTAISAIDGVERIYAYRRVSNFPVYVRFGVSTRSALRPWYDSLRNYGLVAAIASLALVAAAALAVRQTAREAAARRDWAAVAAALRSEVAERGRLEGQLRQAQKMEAVGQLTGGLAHDFNNLLAGITGSLEMIDTRIGQGRFADIQRYTGIAQGAAKRAAALTHRLLAFSRRQTLDPKATDLNRLVAGMEDMVRRTMGPAIEVEVVAAEGLWTTLVDRNQLENAFLNLCINARDAMPSGGRLIVATANHAADERMAPDTDLPDGACVALRVTDDGTGMAPEIVAKVFDPFFTTKPLGVGTGLGMSMVYGFIQQSGGQICIRSAVGRGTTVSLYLPRHLATERTVEESTAPERASRAKAGETVLVVDDEPSVRLLVVDVLRDLGYEVLEAVDGASGLKLLRSDIRIDLLVTDVGLPGGMNGRQLADAARPVRADLKVLFITGYADRAVVGDGGLEPGTYVMTKPFAMEALGARVREVIADPKTRS